eukprot:scaffold186428_cov32-Tisochrysis_lutea.AAC.1
MVSAGIRCNEQFLARVHTHAGVGVRWGSLQTEPESSFQHDQDKALSILSSEVGDPREVALPG